MGKGVAGIVTEHLVKLTDCLLQVTELEEGAAERLGELRILGLQEKTPLVGVNRLLRLTHAKKHLAQRVYGVIIIGGCGESAPELPGCLVKPPLLGKDRANLVIDVAISRIELRSLPEIAQGFVHFALYFFDFTHFQYGFPEIGVIFNRQVIFPFSLIHPVLLLKRVSQFQVRLGIGGLVIESQPEKLFGLGVIGLGIIADTYLEMGLQVARPEAYCFLKGHDGLLYLAHPVVGQPQVIADIGMLGAQVALYGIHFGGIFEITLVCIRQA